MASKSKYGGKIQFGSEAYVAFKAAKEVRTVFIKMPGEPLLEVPTAALETAASLALTNCDGISGLHSVTAKFVIDSRNTTIQLFAGELWISTYGFHEAERGIKVTARRKEKFVEAVKALLDDIDWTESELEYAAD